MKKPADPLVTFLICASLLAFAVISFSTLASATANETVIYSFNCGPNNCGLDGPLARDSAGNLYGTTFLGGSTTCYGGQGCGTVYELSPDGQGGWIETTIYEFQGGSDGSNPISGVILDVAGNLYGTTQGGGPNNGGTVFTLTHSAKGWTESILGNFSSETLGQAPNGLVFDDAGNLYGTTYAGGTNCNNQGCGTVFELSPTDNGWAQTVLYNFNQQPDAAYPSSSLVFDHLGNLYGTTQGGGAYGYGAVFTLKKSSAGWKEGVLWNFTSGEDGAQPLSVVVYQSALYGTTTSGGNFNVGTIFQLTPALGNWNMNVIHTFTGGNDGGVPFAGLLKAGNNLYGTTFLGGLHEYGTVFQLHSQSDGTWNENVIYSFTGGNDGGNPANQLIAGPGSLFGTTFNTPNLTSAVYELTAK